MNDAPVEPDESAEVEPVSSTEAIDSYERGPDGGFRWPAPDRDSPRLGDFTGYYSPDRAIGALLQMDGKQGRSEDEVMAATGIEIKRPRRWHKIFERMSILYPGEGSTRLGRLGRLLRDAAAPDGMKRLVAREAIESLRRYQFDNPIERSLPVGCSVHPYYIVLRAAAKLDWKIHWDEVNRELMRLTKDSELESAIDRIRTARNSSGYDAFIGRASNDAGLLRARTHPAEVGAPEGKTPEGQLRDQRMTPFLKRVGFGELLLESSGVGGGGYWVIPSAMRPIVASTVESVPVEKVFATDQEWIDWFCEGTSQAASALPLPPAPEVAVPIADLTLTVLKSALEKYEPQLAFSDHLLATLIAALRSGDGKNFIILRGVSGTGKSKLVSAIAKAVYGSANVDRPQLTMLEVRPDWMDGIPLLGYFDPVSQKYIRAPFLDALIAARNDENVPFFICLDEMNLARVEYYLAECLSAMESENPITVDARTDGNVPSRLRWPKNVFLFGTINVDESTHKISDKVLDRAQVIDTSDIQLLPQLVAWSNATDLEVDDKALIVKVLGGVWTALRSVDAHFGYRSARAAIRFVEEAKASSEGALDVASALDMQLCQRVLVKLRGEGDRWIQPLTDTETACNLLGTDSKAMVIVRRMRVDLERLGSFQFWN